MKVEYPYSRHCSISRLKKTEQIHTEEIINGRRIIRCFVCKMPMAMQPGNRDAPKSWDCPTCDGKKSWAAYRCKHCYRKLKLSRRINSEDEKKFREKIRLRISEIADEMGQTNYWKSSSN